ncbi:unnamed protein product [Urochloa humidicola]
MSRMEQREDTIALLPVPTITDGRLVLPDGFEFTRNEVNEASTELLEMAELVYSNEVQVPIQVRNALHSYKFEPGLQSAVNAAASDPNIFRAFVANEHVNSFFATLKEGARHAIAVVRTNMNKIRMGHSEGSGQEKANTKESGFHQGSSQARGADGNPNKVRMGADANFFSLAIKKITEFLKRIWNFLFGQGGKVLESVQSTLNSVVGHIKEGYQSFIILLLGIFRRNLEIRMYHELSDVQ